MSGERRARPNILVTGTPGTGKTTTCSLLADATKLRQANVGDLVKTKELHDGWDDEFECHVINEDLPVHLQQPRTTRISHEAALHQDRAVFLIGAEQEHGSHCRWTSTRVERGSTRFNLEVCDELEDMMQDGGNIVDYHGCDFFPECWFDRVVVLQTDNSILHDRLTSRGYMGTKLTNNIECEIFQVLLEEAKSSYPEDIVVALQSDTVEDISRNVTVLTEWANNWRPSRPS